MAATAARGTTVLRNAACEPHVQDLAHFLCTLGAKIEGIGTNTVTIHGGQPIGGGTHRIGPDHIEVGSFIGLAAVTRSEIRIEDAGVEHLRSTLHGIRAARHHVPRRGRRPHRSRRAVARDPVRPRRTRAEARGSAVAGVPGGRDVDRDRHRDAVQRTDSLPREDVRVAHVLRRQADRHGRAHRAVRSAPRAGRRPVAAARGDGGVARHSRRHGDAARRDVRRRARARSTTPARSSAATSASTSDSTRSAPGSRAWTTAGGDRGCARDARRTRRRYESRAGVRRVRHSRVHDDARRGELRRRRATNRFAMSWRAGIAARASSRRPVRGSPRRTRCTATVSSSHGTGWDGWLRVRRRRRPPRAATAGPRLAVSIADCVPVFIAHPSGAIALLHSGWRGTAARIVERAIDLLESRGIPRASCSLHCGPSICGDCYEVSPDVYRAAHGARRRRSRRRSTCEPSSPTRPDSRGVRGISMQRGARAATTIASSRIAPAMPVGSSA